MPVFADNDDYLARREGSEQDITDWVPEQDINRALIDHPEEIEWPVKSILEEYDDEYLVQWEGIDPASGKPWDPSRTQKSELSVEDLKSLGWNKGSESVAAQGIYR